MSVKQRGLGPPLRTGRVYEWVTRSTPRTGVGAGLLPVPPPPAPQGQAREGGDCPGAGGAPTKGAPVAEVPREPNRLGLEVSTPPLYQEERHLAETPGLQLSGASH